VVGKILVTETWPTIQPVHYRPVMLAAIRRVHGSQNKGPAWVFLGEQRVKYPPGPVWARHRLLRMPCIEKACGALSDSLSGSANLLSFR